VQRRARSSVAERPAHNRLVAGSNPAEPTFEAKFPQIPPVFYENAQVQPQISDLLQLRDMMYILLGNKGRRHLELRHKTNKELFKLYEGELAFRHRSARGIHEAKRILNHFHNHLGEFPPTPELAKSFLSQFKDRKPTTIARYVAILKVFFKWYGEELDINIRVSKILPSYVKKSDIDLLLEALKSKRSHKETINRDILLIDLAIHTGLRRSELANLKAGDIDLDRQVLIVRQGKGSKDRIIPISENTCDKLDGYVKGKNKKESLFGLAPASISGKIRTFSNKAGVKLHTHSLRDYFATSLSEKGATIREIQSLLGHSNLTHTERYTLHTDKHLKRAVELFDKEQIEEQKQQEQLQLQQIVILKVVEKKDWPDDDNILRSEYFSHFLGRNEGQNPVIEIDISLFDTEYHLLEVQKESVLGNKEEFIFKPMVKLAEGSYLLECEYKAMNSVQTYHTILPFEVKKASKENEVYVIPRELKFEIDSKRINNKANE